MPPGRNATRMKMVFREAKLGFEANIHSKTKGNFQVNLNVQKCHNIWHLLFFFNMKDKDIAISNGRKSK